MCIWCFVLKQEKKFTFLIPELYFPFNVHLGFAVFDQLHECISIQLNVVKGKKEEDGKIIHK
jgi:hypothetical protein